MGLLFEIVREMLWVAIGGAILLPVVSDLQEPVFSTLVLVGENGRCPEFRVRGDGSLFRFLSN